jgi:hypothetical protein
MGHKEEEEMLQAQLRASNAPKTQQQELQFKKHLRFHLFHMQQMPSAYQSLESNHNTMSYMAVAGSFSSFGLFIKRLQLKMRYSVGFAWWTG